MLHGSGKSQAMCRRLLCLWDAQDVLQEVGTGDALIAVARAMNDGHGSVRVAVANADRIGNVGQGILPRVRDGDLTRSGHPARHPTVTGSSAMLSPAAS